MQYILIQSAKSTERRWFLGCGISLFSDQTLHVCDPVNQSMTTTDLINESASISTTCVVDDIDNEHDKDTRPNNLPKLNWTRLNYKGENHDRRRLLQHRAKNCECEVCYRELQKLPPAEPLREIYAKKKHKLEQREVRKVKRLAKKDVKAGKQACIRNFFRY